MTRRWCRCRAGGQTPSVGWVFTCPIMTHKVCYWKNYQMKYNKHERKWQRKLNLTFKINMTLPFDVGKVVAQGGRPNSACGMSFHLSHHVTQSILLKNLSDVVKLTWAKTAKEILSTFKINTLLTIDVDKAVGWGRVPNSFCGLRFNLSHHDTQSILLKNLSVVVK